MVFDTPAWDPFIDIVFVARYRDTTTVPMVPATPGELFLDDFAIEPLSGPKPPFAQH